MAAQWKAAAMAFALALPLPFCTDQNRSSPHPMNATSAQPFALSLALHLVCGVALVAVLARPIQEIAAPTRPENPFSIVPSDPGSATTSGAQAAAQTVRFPSLPKLPKFVPAPESDDAASAPQTTAVATLAALTRAAPARISIEEYRHSHGLPTNRIERPAPVRSLNVPRVNVADFAFRGGEGNKSATVAGDGSAGVGSDFGARLLTELRRSYSNSEAAFAGLSAQVEFTLNSDGGLKNARLIEPSGSSDFDQAVLSTFNRVKASGFLPSEIGKSFRVRFHVADGS
jgi:TonB family protein